MKSPATRLRHILLILWLLVGLPGTAHAYLDPGTGSFVLQMLVAGLLGAVLYVKMAWQSIKLFFSNLFSGKKDPRQEPMEDDKP